MALRAEGFLHFLEGAAYVARVGSAESGVIVGGGLRGAGSNCAMVHCMDRCNESTLTALACTDAELELLLVSGSITGMDAHAGESCFGGCGVYWPPDVLQRQRK